MFLDILSRVRKAQLSLGSAASNDSGFGSGGLDQQARHSVRHNNDDDDDDDDDNDNEDDNDDNNNKPVALRQ